MVTCVHALSAPHVAFLAGTKTATCPTHSTGTALPLTHTLCNSRLPQTRARLQCVLRSRWTLCRLHLWSLRRHWRLPSCREENLLLHPFTLQRWRHLLLLHRGAAQSIGIRLLCEVVPIAVLLRLRQGEPRRKSSIGALTGKPGSSTGPLDG